MTTDLQRFDTGELELAYRAWPGESPPVVFLHGISGGMSSWEPRIELRGKQAAYAYDARGHGDSGRAKSYRFTDFGEDAVRFLEGVVREPAILVGHSLGGMTAIYAAGKSPGLVAGAFLVDPPLYAPMVGLRHEREPFAQRRALAGKPVDEIVASAPQNQPAAVLSAMASQLNKLDEQTLWQMLEGTAFEGWDTDVLLRRVNCPILLEHGERAYGAGIAASALYEGEVERAAALLRNCTVVQIEGSGHIPMVQQPQRFAEVLTSFIQKLTARP
jgi:pimeloyl-ACP methyl ester carboxylesterase